MQAVTKPYATKQSNWTLYYSYGKIVSSLKITSQVILQLYKTIRAVKLNRTRTAVDTYNS